MGALKKPEYRKTVEQMLKQYPILKMSADGKGNSVIEFPSNQVKKVEKALEQLKDDEKKVIEETFFKDHGCKVIVLAEQLGMSFATYKRKKRKAIEKIAQAINLIDQIN